MFCVVVGDIGSGGGGEFLGWRLFAMVVGEWDGSVCGEPVVVCGDGAVFCVVVGDGGSGGGDEFCVGGC